MRVREKELRLSQVGKEFRELLSAHALFKGKDRAVVGSWEMLKEINRLGDSKWKEEEAPWYSHKDIKAHFRRLGPHAAYLRCLSDGSIPARKGERSDVRLLGLFKALEYKVPIYGIRRGEARGYVLYPDCKRMIAEGTAEWLRRVKGDKALSRRYGKRRAAAMAEAEQVPDEFTRMVRKICCEVEVDPLPEGGADDPSWRIMVLIMDELQEADFEDLGLIKGRVYHPLVRTPRKYRRLLKLGGMRRLAEVDIRCCWPTFYARCLRAYYETRARRRSKSKKLRGIDSSELSREVERWEALFCADRDPREVLLGEKGFAEIGINRAQMKEALNSWINGGTKMLDGETGQENRAPFEALSGWLLREYPQLFQVRGLRRPRDFVSTHIPMAYESPIMTDMELYRLGESLGFRLIPEHDGVGVFALPESSPNAQALGWIAGKIRELAMRHAGVPVVVKEKLVS